MKHAIQINAVPLANSSDRFCNRPSHSLPTLARVTLTALCACLSTTALAETKTFDLSGFNGISAAEGIHVIATAGENFAVSAESDDARQLERLVLDVRRGTLRAEMDNQLFSLIRTKDWKVTVRVTLPSLIQAEASSGAELIVDTMSGSALELESSSGSTLRVETIDGETISADVSSGANIMIGGGTCNSLQVDVSSGSSLDMEQVQCAFVEVDASSGSSATVFAAESIDGDASSGAAIHVYGTHERIEIQVSSGGNIKFP